MGNGGGARRRIAASADEDRVPPEAKAFTLARDDDLLDARIRRNGPVHDHRPRADCAAPARRCRRLQSASCAIVAGARRVPDACEHRSADARAHTCEWRPAKKVVHAHPADDLVPEAARAVERAKSQRRAGLKRAARARS